MVYKDAKIGKTKNVTLIELGDGDIKLASVHCKEDGYAGIEFVNDVKRPIGTHHNNTAGTTTDESSPQAMLTFKNIESLEVFEDKLRKAKIHLKNIIKQREKATNQKQNNQ